MSSLNINHVTGKENLILLEQLNLGFKSVPFALTASLICSSLLIYIMWPVIGHGSLIFWAVCMLLVCGVRGYYAYQYKHKIKTEDNIDYWYRKFLLISILAGLSWGAAALLIFPLNDMIRQLFLVFVVGGIAAGSITNVSCIKPAAYLYLLLSIVPFSVKFILSGTALGYEMGSMASLFLIVMLLSAKRIHEFIISNISLTDKCKEFNLSLKLSELRYKKLLETAADSFFLHNREGNFIDVNIQACESLGYSREELLKLSVEDVEVGVNQKEFAILWPKLEQNEVVQLEGVHQRKDGSTFPVEVRLSLIKLNNDTCVSVLARDIGERRKNEKYMHDSQQRMALHVQRTPLGVIEWDLNFRVIEWNNSAERIFGYTKKEAVGEDARDLIIPTSSKEHVDEVWALLLAQRNGLRSTNENVTKNGKIILCEWYNTPLVNESGDVIGVSSLVQDVTLEKNAVLEIIRARDEAELANKAKSEFLSHMSHEIRTPMTAILGFSQIMEGSKDLSEKHKKYSSEITKAGNHLIELINDILDLSSIEAGKLDCTIKTVELGEIVLESLSYVNGEALKNNVKLVDKISSESNYYVKVDSFRFKQVLINILSNAVKYNKKDGSVVLSAKEIGANKLRVSVQDTGVGFSEIEQLSLFKPFERIGEYKGIDGTGIGLVITKRLIEMMGGSIGLESEPGEGSIFWVDISLADKTIKNLEMK